MKSYIINLATYGMNCEVIDYDYDTAAALWNECDELNETLRHHTVTLEENASGSLILTAESDGSETFAARIERMKLAHEIERIADEYGAFELPSRYLMGEPELNEMFV